MEQARTVARAKQQRGDEALLEDSFLLAAMALFSLFGITVPVSGYICHRIWGGGRMSVGGYIAMQVLWVGPTAIMFLGTSSGWGLWSAIPAVLAMYATLRIAEWLELHDVDTDDRDFSILTVRRVFVTCLVLGIASIWPVSQIPMPWVGLAFAVPGTLLMTAFLVITIGTMLYRRRHPSPRSATRYARHIANQ
jgi:hypothetical protein